jgi:hypothetical protein
MEQHGNKTSSAIRDDDLLKAVQDAYNTKAKAGTNVACTRLQLPGCWIALIRADLRLQDSRGGIRIYC